MAFTTESHSLTLKNLRGCRKTIHRFIKHLVSTAIFEAKDIGYQSSVDYETTQNPLIHGGKIYRISRTHSPCSCKVFHNDTDR